MSTKDFHFSVLSTFNAFTHLSLMFHFYTPWKRGKIKDSLKFLGGIEVDIGLKSFNPFWSGFDMKERAVRLKNLCLCRW